MTPAADVQRYLSAAWQLMLGRREGLDGLDLSVDGFWNSFYAMIVAFPALVVGWVSLANQLGGAELGSRVSVLVRLGVIDFMAWTIPLALLAVVSKPAGIAHRYIPYVVASNWGSALLIWAMAPLSVAELVFPDTGGVLDLVSFVVFVTTLVLSWRLTRTSLDMGPAVAAAVFGGIFTVSLVLILGLQTALGLTAQ